MKLAAREAGRLWAAPPATWPGLLIYGADPMRVALKRAEAAAALAGPGAEAEMRLVRLAGSDLRRDPAALADALRAQGFFPGPRVVVLDDATDGLAETVAAALQAFAPGDARLIATAGALKTASSLRKLFEGHRAAHALPLYDDPPGRDEVLAMLAAEGLAEPDRAAMADLMALAGALEPGDLRQTVTKLGLYKLGDPAPVGPEDIAACAPASTEAAVDDLLHLAAEAREAEIPPTIRRLAAQGVQPVKICIDLGRHFRLLHAAVADPANAARHLAAVRNFKARQRMERQARMWRRDRLEAVLALLVETDLGLRSAARAPGMAVVERALIRIARLNGRRPG